MINKTPEGILLVDKPKGITSFDLVAQVRRTHGIRAVGHTGTLDPFATGLMVVLLGRYTRFSHYITSEDKVYEAEVLLGQGTDTDDCDGQVVSEAWVHSLETEEIEAALQQFMGKQLQVPPIYSAISIGGERAYKKARRGEQLELPAREIEIFELKLLKRVDHHRFCFRAHVSKGTYIRALARDLGRTLGFPAHLTELRRTRVGHYDIKDCSPELREGPAALLNLPKIAIDESIALAIRKGQKPSFPLDTELDFRLALAHYKDEIIGIVRVEQGCLIPVRGF
ncbi:MAG: tRNA pseudouridine(55) synthase TruB [Myxococcaceae bacterium]|nr:tRNA pseudouridine(55) synthase TruB [Myxococcaceae bacterium]MBH2006184.1 tRNA pseudouridine(55) synthase TruB [Myxococcaceae bacterium]